MTDVQDYRYGEELVPENGSRDVPVNPYSLLEAVNDASEVAHTSWLIFLGVLAYLCVAVAGVSHKDLLLNQTVSLPILQVDIELTRFFMFAPFVLLAMHFGLLVQHVMLARKVIEFDGALRPLEATDKRTHPLRLEIHSYFFTQAIAGPERSALFSLFLHLMIWATVIVLPVMVIFYIQATFLPYHDIDITWGQRIALVLDVMLLLGIGIFLRRAETSFWGAFWRIARYSPIQFAVTGGLFILVLFASFCVATIPDEWLDRVTSKFSGLTTERIVTAAASGPTRSVFSVTAWFFEGTFDPNRGKYSSFFQRNLIVTDTDLVSDKDEVPGEVTISLRDRDLRLARLDRSDLHGADLTGANLTQATLSGTDLRRTKMSCTDPAAALIQKKDRTNGCTLLNDAIMKGAKLGGANLRLAFLSGAKLDNANLVDADLSYTEAVGADFSNAEMQNASLSGAELTGANFLAAKLEGADLSGTKLLGADFSSAKLQGARFPFALAVATNFKGADLDVATLGLARLYAADLSSITAIGTDFSQAVIWQAKPPGKDAKLDAADLSQIKIKPPSEKDLATMEEAIGSLRDPKLKERIEAVTLAVRNLPESQSWEHGADQQAWEALMQSGPAADPQGYKSRLTAVLSAYSCQIQYADSGVASGAARRALGPNFKGDPAELLLRLKAKSCPAEAHISNELIDKLAALVESRRPVVAPVAAVVPAPVDAGAVDPPVAANP